MLKEVKVTTQSRSQMVDVTQRVSEAVAETGIRNGVCLIFVPHTTAGITINENADPSVVADILKETNKIVPWDDDYKHLEGNAAAHIKASMMGCAQVVLVENGRLLLGTWQGIYFCEFDGPRSRKILLKVLADK